MTVLEKKSTKLFFTISWIYGCFIVYGLAQERLFGLRDATNPQWRFTYGFTGVFMLVLSNTFLSFLSLRALVIIDKNSSKSQQKPVWCGSDKGMMGPTKTLIGWLAQAASRILPDSCFPWKCPIRGNQSLPVEILREFILIGTSYAMGMALSNYALACVGYPTQVLVKSAKLVPVVVGGVIIFKKQYHLQEYLCVGIVTASLIVFNIEKITKGSSDSSVIGYLLLGFSLMCDALTGPRQDALAEKFPQSKTISPVLNMFITNICALLITGILALSLEGAEPWRFIYANYASAVPCFSSFCISASLGQLGIFYSLRRFGSLYTTLFTTVRKAASTMLSVWLFGHHISAIQWSAITVLFTALLFNSIVKKSSKAKKGTKQHFNSTKENIKTSQSTNLVGHPLTATGRTPSIEK